MKAYNAQRVYQTLQKLNALEISYLEYSKQPKNFEEYQAYLEYFNNYAIRAKELSRFYFPLPLTSCVLPRLVTDIGDVLEIYNIPPTLDFAISKLFNFPAPLRHRCDYFTLICQMEGTGKLILDTATFEMNPGDFYIVPPNIYYTLESTLESMCICLNLRRSFVASEYRTIFMEHPQLTRFVADALEGSATYAAMHTHDHEPLNDLILTIFAEYINQDEYSNVAMRSYLTLLIAAILRDNHTEIDSSTKVTRMDAQFRQIEVYLKKNYQTATLTDLADTIHFSKQYICRIVKEKTGDTFNSLLIHTRLSNVEHFLCDTALSLEDIAYLCGFSAASHMSRCFKEAYGVTPSKFRANRKKSVSR